MRLISLEITNFRVIKEARLTFPDKVIGIIGRNGSGKSSIIEAISWALYGNQAARTGRDEIKATYAGAGENCEVNLAFAVNGEKYRVVRRLVGRTGRPEVQLYRGDASESVGVNETKQYVGQLLGLDWRGFLSSFLARQQELNALSDLQPSKRRDHIAGMLGIERLDKAIQHVKEDSKLNLARVQVLDRQLADKELVEKDVAGLSEKLAGLGEPLAKKEAAFKRAQEAFARITEAYREAQEKEAKWREGQVRLEAEQKSLTVQTERLGELNSEKAKLSEAQAERDRLAGSLEQLPVVKQEVEQLSRRKAEAELMNQLLRQKKQYHTEIESLHKHLSQQETERQAIAEQLRPIPENIERLTESARERLEKAREEYSRISAEIDARKREAVKLEGQMSSIAELGPESVCDRCLRPMGDDLESIKSHLGQELDQLKQEVQTLAEKQATLRQSGIDLKKEFEQLQSQSKAAYELRLKVEALDGRIAEQTKRATETTELLKQVVEQIDQKPAEEFDPARLEELAAKLAELEKVQQRCSQLDGSLGRLPEVEQGINDSRRKIDEIKAAVQRLNSELEKLGFSEEEYASLKRSFTEGQDEVDHKRDQHMTAVREKELTEKELSDKLERLKSFDRTARELEENRSAHYYGQKLGGLLGEYRKDLIASIRPSLADLSSRLINDMTDGRYSLVDLDDKYNLQVMDAGEYFGVERFSGGEKDLANLCLRLAISLALTESAGLDRSFVILDEVFGSQDVQRKELILGALANLKSRFPQILLVTHVEDIKEGVEQLITVEPTGAGWSEVKVDGEKV